jgi:hypothetical protein
MRVNRNDSTYTAGHVAMSILPGWSADPYQPQHRSLEALAAEVEDVVERDAAARATFARQVRHG